MNRSTVPSILNRGVWHKKHPHSFGAVDYALFNPAVRAVRISARTAFIMGLIISPHLCIIHKAVVAREHS